MLAEHIRTQTLCDELQLGTSLNRCTHGGESEKFRLLLSMLSGNVCDQAQFDMSRSEPKLAELSLREKFALSEPRPLLADQHSFATASALRSLFDSDGIIGVKLAASLSAAPLHAADEVGGVSSEVMNNVDLLTRLKHQAKHPRQPAESEVKGVDMFHVLNDFDYDKPLKTRHYA